MGRIEEALRKLEEQRRQGPRRVSSAEPAPVRKGKALGPLKPLTLNAAHDIVLDETALRRWGPVLLGGTDRARREYGQVKRPVKDNALGRSAAPVAAGNVVLVTSALSGEGKSLTALNLSLSLALEKDLAVVLIDADTVKPDLSHTLRLDRAKGLTDLLAEDQLEFAEILHRTSVSNLFFVAAGTQRAEATELLSSQRMLELLEALARDLPRTIVVIDSSPLLLTNESTVLLSLAGQVVLVVRANRTPRLVLTEALDRLDPAKPVGLVLNATSAGEAGYYGAYGPGNDEQSSAA